MALSACRTACIPPSRALPVHSALSFPEPLPNLCRGNLDLGIMSDGYVQLRPVVEKLNRGEPIVVMAIGSR